MTDEEALIKTTFEQYADAFQALKPGVNHRFGHSGRTASLLSKV
jgi:hypothetical protein